MFSGQFPLSGPILATPYGRTAGPGTRAGELEGMPAHSFTLKTSFTTRHTLLSDSLRPPPALRQSALPTLMTAWHLLPRLGPPANFESQENSIVYIITKSPERYLDVVEKNAILQKITLAAVLIAVWDWLTKFDDEVSYVWKRRSRLTGKPLYLFLRYGGIAFQLYDCIQLFAAWSAQFCTTYYYILPIGTAAFLYAVDLLLAYRALCLYRMNRKLVFANIVLFSFSVIAWTIFTVVAYGGFRAIPTPDFLTGCWSSLGAFIFLSAIPGLLFELWLFILVGYRMLVYSKAVGWNRSEILDLIMKDAVSWFLVIQALILLNAFSLSVMPLGMRTFAIPPFRTAIIICGCRLIIRMRKAAAVADAESNSPEELELTDQPSRFSSRRTPFKSRTNRPSRSTNQHQTTTQSSVTGEVGQWCRRAQRILGLPPPLESDFDDMWYDPVVTISLHAVDSEAIRSRSWDDPELGYDATPKKALSPLSPYSQSSLGVDTVHHLEVPNHRHKNHLATLEGGGLKFSRRFDAG